MKAVDQLKAYGISYVATGASVVNQVSNGVGLFNRVGRVTHSQKIEVNGRLFRAEPDPAVQFAFSEEDISLALVYDKFGFSDVPINWEDVFGGYTQDGLYITSPEAPQAPGTEDRFYVADRQWYHLPPPVREVSNTSVPAYHLKNQLHYEGNYEIPTESKGHYESSGTPPDGSGSYNGPTSLVGTIVPPAWDGFLTYALGSNFTFTWAGAYDTVMKWVYADPDVPFWPAFNVWPEIVDGEYDGGQLASVAHETDSVTTSFIRFISSPKDVQIRLVFDADKCMAKLPTVYTDDLFVDMRKQIRTGCWYVVGMGSIGDQYQAEFYVRNNFIDK